MCTQTRKLISWAHPFIAFMKRSIIRDPVDERYPHASNGIHIFNQCYKSFSVLYNSHYDSLLLTTMTVLSMSMSNRASGKAAKPKPKLEGNSVNGVLTHNFEQTATNWTH